MISIKKKVATGKTVQLTAKPAPIAPAEEATKVSRPVDLRVVAIDDVAPNDYNPNVMDDRVFDELVADLSEEDLDQPVVVRPDPEREGKWIIVDGEHRWRGSKHNGRTEIHISVRDYSEEEAMIKTVRRNVLHGEMDKGKFSEMIARLNTNGITPERARELMAVNVRQFDTMWRGATAATAQRAEHLISTADKGVQLTSFVANLSQMVRDIVVESGDDIEEGYIAFMYKGKPCMMVSMDAVLQKVVKEYFSGAKEDGKTQAEISIDLQNAFKSAMGG